MADFHKNKLYRPPNPRLANLLLVGLVVLTFTFCLLLYTGMVSTRKSRDVLAESQLVPSDVLVELNNNYERERTLGLVLIVVSGCIGLIFIVFYRYLLRLSTSLREIQTIDHDILNSITRGILTANLQGEITSCNQALEQILGVSGTKLVGRSLEEAFRTEDPLYQLLKESLQGEARPQNWKNRQLAADNLCSQERGGEEGRGDSSGQRYDRNPQDGRKNATKLQACSFGPAHAASGP